MLSKKSLFKHIPIEIIPVFLLILFAANAAAQSYQGTLRGAVTDGGGRALAAATLSLTNEQTNVTRTTVSNEAGEYVFERVDPGRYKINATLNGSKRPIGRASSWRRSSRSRSI